jgi:hypothetical protein
MTLKKSLATPKLPIRASAGAVVHRAAVRADGSADGSAEAQDGPSTAPNGEAYDLAFIASTERLATDGGVILLDAWTQGLAAFMQRPRFLSRHDISGYTSDDLEKIAIGRVVYVAIESGFDVAQVGPSGRALVAYVRFMSNPSAQAVLRLYQEGGLDDVSVRWDYRTFEARHPTEEEVQRYGEDCYWIGLRADMMELSAVVYGADPGAQQKPRAAVLAAMEACRAKGVDMVPLEAWLAENVPANVPARAERGADAPAVQDALQMVERAMQGFDAWLDAGQQLRDSLNEGMTSIANLVAASQDPNATDEGAGDSASGSGVADAAEDRAATTDEALASGGAPEDERAATERAAASAALDELLQRAGALEALTTIAAGIQTLLERTPAAAASTATSIATSTTDTTSTPPAPAAESSPAGAQAGTAAGSATEPAPVDPGAEEEVITFDLDAFTAGASAEK